MLRKWDATDFKEITLFKKYQHYIEEREAHICDNIAGQIHLKERLQKQKSYNFSKPNFNF